MSVRLGQDAHGGQQLVDLQEVGVAVAEERAEAGVDHHGDEGDEDHQVDQAGIAAGSDTARRDQKVQSCPVKIQASFKHIRDADLL